MKLRKKTPVLSSGKRSDPGDRFYTAWADELEACINYSSSTLLKKATPKEMALACLYEYTREVSFLRYADPSSLEQFFTNRPFYLLLDQSPQCFEVLCARPWLNLPPEQRKRIMGQISYPYGNIDPESLPVSNMISCLLDGTLDGFAQSAKEALNAANTALQVEDYTLFRQISERQAILPQGKSSEKVIITINYGYSKKAICQLFKHWLNSQDKKFLEHHVEMHGSKFFRDRLRDLGNWRLHRRYGMKGLDALIKRDKRYAILNTDASYSDAKRNALKLVSLLPKLRFENLRQLETAYVKVTEREWRDFLKEMKSTIPESNVR